MARRLGGSAARRLGGSAARSKRIAASDGLDNRHSTDDCVILISEAFDR
jgi:hypothetical protein